MYQDPVRTFRRMERKYDAEVFGLYLYSEITSLDIIQEIMEWQE